MEEIKEGVVIEFQTSSNADSPVLRGGVRNTNSLGLITIVGGETYELRKLLNIKIVPDLYTELRYVPRYQGEPMKTKCIKTYPALAHRMKEGDLIDVVPVRYSGNVLVEGSWERDENGKRLRQRPDEIHEYKDKMHHLFYRCANGDEIPDSIIHWTIDKFLSKDLN